ncbi:MAG: hypothetical protein ACREHD_20060 [Pirellulales bacterium]
MIEAVETGEIAVSDAAAVVELPKPRQRELLERVRSGKSRTLRAAAKAKQPRALPAAVLDSDQEDPQVMRGKVRRAYRFFMDDYESMLHYLDLAVEGCGTNERIIRARQALSVAQRCTTACCATAASARERSRNRRNDIANPCSTSAVVAQPPIELTLRPRKPARGRASSFANAPANG